MKNEISGGDLMDGLERYYSKSLPEVNETIIRKLVPYLDADEKIIWFGKPRQGLINKMRIVIILMYALIFKAIVDYFIFYSHDLQPTHSWQAVLISFGILIVIVLIDIYRRKKVYYAISHTYIFIISGLLDNKVEVLNIDDYEIKLKEQSDGFGTINLVEKSAIKFAQSHPTYNKVLIKKLPSIYRLKDFYPDLRSRLYQIPNAATVYRLLVKLT